MGNQMTTAIGDSLSCFREHTNVEAVGKASMSTGIGKDLDDAVLAATENSINAANALQQTLKLSFACKNLPNMDTFSRSDGMALLQEKKGNIWKNLGFTEIVKDNLNPEWIKDFEVPYKFEEQQVFRVSVYDVDDFDNPHLLSNHDFIGSVDFTLHEVVTAADQILTRPISQTKKDATIEIAGVE